MILHGSQIKPLTVFSFCMALFLVCGWGCGYQFAGSGSYPGGVKQIFIPLLKNRTAETGVERTFTNDLINEFTRNRKESLAADRSAADGILSGTIVTLAVTNVARTSVSQAVERRVTGTLSLQLTTPEGQLLWASGDIVERQAYAVVADNKSTTDRNKSEAIAIVSEKLAESAFNRLTDDF